MNLSHFPHELLQRLTLGTEGAGSLADVLVTLLHELARGEALAPAALANAMGQPLAPVAKSLARMVDTEKNEAGHIVGYILTLRHTAHAFQVNGQRLHTWCAFDALLVPPVIGQTAHVTSTCPATSTQISLTAAPDGLRDIRPAGTVLSLTMPQDGSSIRSAFCRHVRFFASADVATGWAKERPGITVVALDDAFAAARSFAQQLLQAQQGTHAEQCVGT